jgi:allantoinase
VFLPDRVVRSRRVVTTRGTRAAAVHIRNERIIGVLDFDDVPQGCPLDDAGDMVVMPGLVDTHVHAFEPACGRSPYHSATRAAAAGGVTTIIDMPFPGPPATSVAALASRRRDAADCFVDVGFWGGVVPGNVPDLGPLFEAGVFGFKCLLRPSEAIAFPHVSERDLTTAMPALTRIGAPLLAHAEFAGPIGDGKSARGSDGRWLERVPWLSRRRRDYARYLEGRPKAAENEAIVRLVELCRVYHTHTHVVHLSSSEALTPLYHGRAARLPITAETCPHYLYFAADEMTSHADAYSHEPPIRERENREFLWAALANGLIQMVVSDHAAAARTGIAAVQLSLSAVWTEAAPRGYTLDQVAGWMSGMPSQLAGVPKKGKIDVGYDADLIVFAADCEFVVESASLYRGRRLRGVVERTYLRGTPIYSRASGWSSPQGRLLARGVG